jgi:hypothetical protein
MWVTVLRAALLAVVLTAVCLSPSALAAELLACQAKDAVNLQKDGTLKTDSVAQRAAQGSLVIDLSNGKVRSDGEQESLKMTVRQHGNDRAYLRTRVCPQRNPHLSNRRSDRFLAIPSRPFHLGHLRTDSMRMVGTYECSFGS